MSSFRSPRCMFINVIRNSSYLAYKQVPFLFKFDLISLILGFLVDFPSRHLRSANEEIKSHEFKNVDNLGIPV